MLVNTGLPLTEEIDALGPAPKRKRGTPELDRHPAIIKALTLALPAGTVVYRITNEQRARPGATRQQQMRFHAKRRASGVVFGFPDLGALVPAQPGQPHGRALFFEVKDRGKKADERQAELHAHLNGIGHAVFVVHDAAEAADAVRAAGIAPRQSRLDP